MEVLSLKDETGLYIFACIWILALIICLATKIPSIGSLSIAAAIIISIILIFLPQESQFLSAEQQSMIYDYISVSHSRLIALVVVIGLGLFLLNTMEPAQAQNLRLERAILRLGEILLYTRSEKKVLMRHIGECAVCHDKTFMVRTYPCRHSSLCKQCLKEIFITGSRVCPLCQRDIQGFRKAF